MLLWKSRHVQMWNGPEIIGIMASIPAEGCGLLIDQSRFGTGFRILNKDRCLRVCGLVTKRWCGLLFRCNSPLIRPHTCAAVVITVFHRKIACYPFRSSSVTSVPTIKILNQFRSLSCCCQPTRRVLLIIPSQASITRQQFAESEEKWQNAVIRFPLNGLIRALTLIHLVALSAMQTVFGVMLSAAAMSP